MNYRSLTITALCIGFLGLHCSHAEAQYKEDKTIQESIQVINEIMSVRVNAIPQKMLADAQAVAIIPGVIKGSFVVGARRGNGVVMVRDEHGQWVAPVFITLTGGNIGFQVGVQSTDVVLVFKTRKSVEGLMSGRLTLGADAAVAAGPVGRQAAAATDTKLSAQIYSYSRSRGLFAGVALDGSVVRLDSMSNAAYYRPTAPGGPVAIPPKAQQLAQQVIHYVDAPAAPSVQAASQPSTASLAPSAGSQIPVQQAGWPKILAGQHSLQEIDHLRDQLAKLAPELYELLDPSWQQYLGLPAQIFHGNGHPSLEELGQSVTRFETVSGEAQFAALAKHPKFQSTYGLLKHYYQDLSNTSQQLNLPAPPSGTR